MPQYTRAKLTVAIVVFLQKHQLPVMKYNNMKWKTYHSKSAEEMYLYKFLSKTDFLKFLETGAIWFSRADIFGDKMECVRIADLKEEKPNYENITARKKRFLISCWHLADRESLVLWDTYSDTIDKRRTIAIRFKRIELIALLEDYSIRNHGNFYYTTQLVHGKVVYKQLINVDNELLAEKAVKYPAFRKEFAFKYENEYRFLIQLEHQHTVPGYGYTSEPAAQLPFKIIINPLLSSEIYLPLKKEIENTGFGNKLIESDLNKWLHPELW